MPRRRYRSRNARKTDDWASEKSQDASSATPDSTTPASARPMKTHSQRNRKKDSKARIEYRQNRDQDARHKNKTDRRKHHFAKGKVKFAAEKKTEEQLKAERAEKARQAEADEKARTEREKAAERARKALEAERRGAAVRDAAKEIQYKKRHRARVVRVFVSSTFTDMGAEHVELHARVFPALKELCAARGLTFEPIDLRWGVTQADVLEARTLVKIIKAIDSCGPYMISILGERYGRADCNATEERRARWRACLEAVRTARPDLKDFIEKYGKCSVTELELRYAALSPPPLASSETPQCAEPSKCCVYMRSPAYITRRFGIGDAERAQYEAANEESAKASMRLKDAIRASSLRYHNDYRSPAEFGRLVYADLARQIADDFGGSKSTWLEKNDTQKTTLPPSDPLVAMRDAHGAFAAKFATPPAYIAADELMRALRSHLEASNKRSHRGRQSATGSQRTLLLMGESGSGKSVALSRFCMDQWRRIGRGGGGGRYADRSNWDGANEGAGEIMRLPGEEAVARSDDLLLAHFVESNDPHAHTLATMLWRFAEELRIRFNLPLPKAKIADEEAARAAFYSAVQACHHAQKSANRRGRIILVVDGIERMDVAQRGALKKSGSGSSSQQKQQPRASASSSPAFSSLSAIQSALEWLPRSLPSSFRLIIGVAAHPSVLQPSSTSTATSSATIPSAGISGSSVSGNSASSHLSNVSSGGSSRGFSSSFSSTTTTTTTTTTTMGASSKTQNRSFSSFQKKGNAAESELELLLQTIRQREVGKSKIHALVEKKGKKASKHALVSSSEVEMFFQTLSLRHGLHLVYVPKWSHSESASFAASYVRRVNKCLSAKQISALCALKGAASPLYLRALLDELVSFASFDSLDATLLDLGRAEDTQSLYEKLVAKWIVRYDPLRIASTTGQLDQHITVSKSNNKILERLCQKVLCALASSTVGFTLSQLCSIVAGSSKDAATLKLIKLAMSPLLASLHASLRRDQLYRMDSAALRAAVIAVCAGGSSVRAAGLLLWHLRALPKNHVLVRQLLIPLMLRAGNYSEVSRTLCHPRVLRGMLNGTNRAELYRYWDSLVRAGVKDNALLIAALSTLRRQAIPIPELVNCCIHVADLLTRSGSASEALRVHEMVVSILGGRGFRGQGVEVAEARLRVVEAQLACGQFVEAERGVNEVLQACDKLLIPGHPLPRRARFVLARILKKRGRYGDAALQCARAINMLEEAGAVTGPDRDAELAMYLCAAADGERKADRLKRALKGYTRALQLLERGCGAFDIRLAGVLRAKGITHKKLGDYDMATACLVRAIGCLQVGATELHPEYAPLLVALADVLRKRTKFADAAVLYTHAIHLLEETLGSMHPELGDALVALGRLRKQQGRYQDASPLYTRAMQIIRSTHGNTPHYKEATILLDVGDLHRKRGRYTQAASTYSSALKMLQRTLGNRHVEVAECLHKQALVAKKQARYAEALRLYDQALAMVRASLGASHYKVGIFLSDLADVHRKRADFPLADRTYERSLSIVRNALGHDHEETATVLLGMGKLECARGKFFRADSHFSAARRVVARELHDKHYKMGLIMHAQGESCQLAGKQQKARRHFEEALIVLEEALGTSHPEVAETRQSLGDVAMAEGCISDAQTHYQIALQSVLESFGNQHPKYTLLVERLEKIGIIPASSQKEISALSAKNLKNKSRASRAVANPQLPIDGNTITMLMKMGWL